MNVGSTAPVRRFTRAIAPVASEPTYAVVPRPAAIPSGCQPLGRTICDGNGAAAAAGAAKIATVASEMTSAAARRRIGLLRGAATMAGRLERCHPWVRAAQAWRIATKARAALQPHAIRQPDDQRGIVISTLPAGAALSM